MALTSSSEGVGSWANTGPTHRPKAVTAPKTARLCAPLERLRPSPPFPSLRPAACSFPMLLLAERGEEMSRRGGGLPPPTPSEYSPPPPALIHVNRNCPPCRGSPSGVLREGTGWGCVGALAMGAPC